MEPISKRPSVLKVSINIKKGNKPLKYSGRNRSDKKSLTKKLETKTSFLLSFFVKLFLFQIRYPQDVLLFYL